MYPKDFINDVLISEIGEIKNGHPYLAFGLICAGIEFLGKSLSDDPWHNHKREGFYFKKAIDEVLPKYKSIKNDLYQDLRNGMAHILIPGSKIALSQMKHYPDGDVSLNNHPFRQSGRHILLIEYFYSDFVEACREVIRRRVDSDKFMSKILDTPK